LSSIGLVRGKLAIEMDHTTGNINPEPDPTNKPNKNFPRYCTTTRLSHGAERLTFRLRRDQILNRYVTSLRETPSDTYVTHDI